MVRAILDKLDGIVTCWIFRHVGNAKMEGSTTKDQMADKAGMWLQRSRVRQSENYQLPEYSSTKSI